MANQVLDSPVVPGKLSLQDALIAGGIKPFTERFLAPYVGDGNLVSGGVKIGIAAAMKKNIPDWLALALVMDGAEDVVHSLMGGAINGSSSSDGLTMEVI